MGIQNEEGITTAEHYQESNLMYVPQANRYAQQIEKLLNRHTSETINEILTLYQQKDFLEQYVPCLTELLYVRILAEITREERAVYGADRMIEQFFTIEAFVEEWEQLKAKLWELEYGFDENAEERFYQYVMNRNYSLVVLKYLIGTSAIDRKEMIMRVTTVFLNHGQTDPALELLEMGLQLCRGDEDLLKIRGQLLTALGR